MATQAAPPYSSAPLLRYLQHTIPAIIARKDGRTAIYSTPGESPPLYTLPAANGAITLAILPSVLSVPLALPLYVAGKASGV